MPRPMHIDLVRFAADTTFAMCASISIDASLRGIFERALLIFFVLTNFAYCMYAWKRRRAKYPTLTSVSSTRQLLLTTAVIFVDAGRRSPATIASWIIGIWIVLFEYVHDRCLHQRGQRIISGLPERGPPEHLIAVIDPIVSAEVLTDDDDDDDVSEDEVIDI